MSYYNVSEIELKISNVRYDIFDLSQACRETIIICNNYRRI